MNPHKKILGILYIISGALQIIAMLFISAFMAVLFPIVFEKAEVDAQWVLVWIVPFIRVISAIIIIFFSIPAIIGGIGMLNEKKWSLTLLLILGCFKLFSFPVGTALGIYTIWVYAEEHRKA